MAHQTMWYSSELPEEITDIIAKDAFENFHNSMEESRLYGNDLDKKKRNSKNAWISSDHWIGGFIWHYVQKANRENFLYDLTHIEGEGIQYTQYSEGEHYTWHVDSGLTTHYKPKMGIDEEQAHDFLRINCESIRKLSVVIQLSNYDDYDGGNLQLLSDDGYSYIAPRQKGTVIVFDSRAKHRVLKVKRGVRRSLVAWVCGPRWK
jgi:PKHD-type hydroxylase